METLEKKLEYSFKNPEFITRALTHPSVEVQREGIAFERLEFLGDRVLGLVIAELLFHLFPKEPEGALAKRFAVLVCRSTLIEIAREMGLHHAARLSQEKSINREKRFETILSDTCESVIAAVYLDSNLETVTEVIRKFWLPKMQESIDPPRDEKTALQELVQKQGKKHPTYALIEEVGPSHAPQFIVEVSVQGVPSFRGEGLSKREAEKAAATKLLSYLESEQ